MKVKLKETDEKGLKACGFGSIQLLPLGNDEYNVVDHCGRAEKDLIDLLERCVDVESVTK